MVGEVIGIIMDLYYFISISSIFLERFHVYILVLTHGRRQKCHLSIWKPKRPTVDLLFLFLSFQTSIFLEIESQIKFSIFRNFRFTIGTICIN